MVIVWPEGLNQRKIPMKPSGIEPATSNAVVQPTAPPRASRYHWLLLLLFVISALAAAVPKIWCMLLVSFRKLIKGGAI